MPGANKSSCRSFKGALRPVSQRWAMLVQNRLLHEQSANVLAFDGAHKRMLGARASTSAPLSRPAEVAIKCPRWVRELAYRASG